MPTYILKHLTKEKVPASLCLAAKSSTDLDFWTLDLWSGKHICFTALAEELEQASPSSAAQQCSFKQRFPVSFSPLTKPQSQKTRQSRFTWLRFQNVKNFSLRPLTGQEEKEKFNYYF